MNSAAVPAMDSKNSVSLFFKRYFRRWKPMLIQALLFTAFFAFVELFFHVTQEHDFTSRFIYPILFSFPLGFFFTGIYSLFSERVNCILSTVTAAFAAIWNCTQICYYSVFQTYMEINKVTMAKDVADGFGNEMFDAIASNIPKIIALILVTAVFSLTLFVYVRPKKKNLIICVAAIIVCIILHLICRLALTAGGDGQYSPANMYKQYPRILDNNVESFGVLTSFRLELGDMVFGHKASKDNGFITENGDILNPVGNDTTAPKTDETDPVSTGDGTDTGTDEPPVPVKEKNVLDIDLDALIAQEKNEDLLAIHKYVKSQNGTYTNKYTGMFEGYNVIMICAESFSPYIITPELTPTLYKFSTNGFVFNNYYGMFKSITTNGEYAFCTGLIPQSTGDTQELKTNSTFLLSSTKYMPYGMGNVIKSLGGSTFAYHSNSSSYYKRGETHPNLGYDLCRFKNGSYVNGVFSKNNPLKFSTGNACPNSDEETAIQTLDDYLNNKDENGNIKQFAAYYMTYSGHHPYYDIYTDTTHNKSPMSYENRDIVDKLSYSGVIKSYLAASLEVENMVTEIERRLKEAGVLDKTVIVLTNDHFPYGLSDKQYNQLAGKKIDTNFEKYKNSFICYNSAMKEPIVIDTPCCTVDIMPTLLNLFGYDYDSRLLAGVDILDEKTFHIAMLYNQCFITDKIKFNSYKNETTYIVDKSTVTNDYVNACINYVKNKFTISLQVVSNDYYRVFYDFLNKNK